jgi:hypothetical protein
VKTGQDNYVSIEKKAGAQHASSFLIISRYPNLQACMMLCYQVVMDCDDIGDGDDHDDEQI